MESSEICVVNNVKKAGVTQLGGEGWGGWTNSSYKDRRYNNTEILRARGLKKHFPVKTGRTVQYRKYLYIHCRKKPCSLLLFEAARR